MKEKKPSLYKVKGFRGPTLIPMICPKCEKRRMYRPAGHLISTNKELAIDGKTERLIDVCAICQQKYKDMDEKYMKKQVREAKRAIEDRKSLDGTGVSIEDTLNNGD